MEEFRDMITETSACDHYDRVTHQTRKERTKGTLYQLKLVHNTWKRTLLQQYAFGSDTVLDIGCGRGGDIQKWNDCHVGRVHGVDVSHQLIQEAVRRASASRGRTVCTFQVHDFRHPYDPMTRYAVVSTFFCLHYFCGSFHDCRTLLESVSSALRPHGFWIGICLDGRQVTAWIREGKTSPYVHIRNISVPVDKESDAPSGFGHAYSFEMVDTVTASSGGDAGSIEYLVSMPDLMAAARDVGLHTLFVKPCDIPPGRYAGMEASAMCLQFCFVKKL